MKRTIQKAKKVVLQGYYYLDGNYLPFEENPLHGKTYNDVDISISTKKREMAGVAHEVDVINIEGCNPIECELVDCHKTTDGTLLISICQDWG